MTDTKNPHFLGYLHSFRGLAILKIVLGHAVAAACIGAYGVFDVSYPVLMISEIFYHDSTLYFAIISGLLFSKVLKPKGYVRFYKSKLKNILLPYIFFTVVLTLIKVNFSHYSSFQEGLQHTVSKISLNFIFGKANFALWYIPVLIFLYLMTPVLVFLQNKNRFTKALFILIILVPLFISRIQTLTAYSLRIETMIYFMGSYALGMYLGVDLNVKLNKIRTYKWSIVLMATMSTMCLFYLYKNQMDMVGIVSLKELAFYIQKTCFAFILILMFKKLDTNQPIWLKPIARDSFSIYFIHGSILYALLPLFMFVIGARSLDPLNVLLSMLMVFIFKKIFGKNSRMIVGA
jgi:surface polysaccharide O-acyltransferase-like enzyme